MTVCGEEDDNIFDGVLFLLDSGAKTSVMSIDGLKHDSQSENSHHGTIKGVGGNQFVGAEIQCSFYFDSDPSVSYNHGIKPTSIPGESNQ